MVWEIVMTVVVAALTVLLLWQYARRRAPYQLAWSAALLTGALAGVFYLLTVAAGGSATLFRLYYICGALLIAPLLGLGSMVLLARRALTVVYAALLLVGGVLGIVGIALAPLAPGALSQLAGQPGSAAISSPLALVPIIVLNTLGTIAVVAVALVSLVRALRRGAAGRLVLGNVGVAVGTLVIASAGSMARLGSGAGFWLTMLVGWVILFAGVLGLSGARRADHQPA